MGPSYNRMPPQDNKGRGWRGMRFLEHIEYTPYGELFLERIKDGVEKLPFRFTGKELDPETGLYYYGARYLDPKTSLWLSSDPALGEYIPQAPINDEARKHNQNLPGMGGVFNTVNLHLYHYAGNNPVKYTDPDGRETGILDLRGYFDGLMLKGMSLPGISLINALNSAGNAASNALHGKAEASAQFSFRLTEGKLYGSISFSSKGLSVKTYSQMIDVLTQLEAVVSSPVRTKHGKDRSLTGIEFHIPVGDQSALKKFSEIIGGVFDVETGDMSGTVGGKLSTKLFGSSSFQLSLTLKSSTMGELPTVQGGNFADIFSDQKSKADFESLWKDQ
jgi:RHS repeat-associated protein